MVTGGVYQKRPLPVFLISTVTPFAFTGSTVVLRAFSRIKTADSAEPRQREQQPAHSRHCQETASHHFPVQESWLDAESRSTHHEIRNSGGNHQKSDQPTNKSLLRRSKHLIHFFLEGGLRGDMSIDHTLRLFQTDIPLMTNNLDRFDHIAVPQGLHCRFGKIGRMPWFVSHG